MTLIVCIVLGLAVSLSPPVIPEKQKLSQTPILPTSDGEAGEMAARRQRILQHALNQLGPLSRQEHEQLAHSQSHPHSTPVVSTHESKCCVDQFDFLSFVDWGVISFSILHLNKPWGPPSSLCFPSMFYDGRLLMVEPKVT